MKEEDYELHKGMITKTLGWKAAKEGEGAEAYIKACRTYSPDKGSFSTWLWHNLMIRRKKLQQEASCSNETVSIDDIMGTCLMEGGSFISCNDMLERQLDLRRMIQNLSEDSQTIIRCLFEGMGKPMKRNRINFSTSATGTRNSIRAEIKEYCRGTLEWSWPRYWKAVHEIEQALKDFE